MQHKIDAKNKRLGRLAVEIANLLRGKNKPEFVPYQDTGDSVWVVNADKIKVTGQKLKQKIYYWHSGYPGGIKERSLERAIQDNPGEVLRKAVYGMLPKNKLRNQMINKLKVSRGEKE